jgi:adenine-specific DNA-methyltransferase
LQRYSGGIGWRIAKLLRQQIENLKVPNVYDPTTSEIHFNSTGDVACWFIDTDYNGEGFIVRHAYFTRADNPYEKLRRALKGEIDEAAWNAL